MTAIRERNAKLKMERLAELSAQKAAALTTINLAREKLNRLVPKYEEYEAQPGHSGALAPDGSTLDDIMDRARKDVLGAETYRDIVSARCVGGGRDGDGSSSSMLHVVFPVCL